MLPELEIREGWVTVICLIVVLLCVAWSIQAAQWTQGLSILQGVVLLGGLTGIVLAKSHVPNLVAHSLSALGGLTWCFYLTSRVLAEAADLSTEAAALALDQRIQDFFYIAFTGGSNADSHIFLLILALLMWVTAYFCAWAVFRWQRVWWAVVVSGIALMLNINYTAANLTGYVITFLLFALLLVVRTSLASYEQEWRFAGVGYSPEMVHGFVRAGLVISVLAILLAWIAPEALASRPLRQVLDKVGEPWRRLQDESSRVFQDLNYQNEPAFLLSDRWMTFGGPVELSDAPIMDVQAYTGRYWRVMVFHEYTGEGWNNTDAHTIYLEENEQGLAFPELELRREVTQTITLQRNLGVEGTIAAAGQPLRARLPLRAAVNQIASEEDLTAPPNESPEHSMPSDPSVLYSLKFLQAGESYQVVSSLSRADEESLRQASTDYPSSVASRYLQLPESLPQRVRLLAEQITADQETPYDKAKAVEGYLRDIPYNERIEGPAPREDGVDYFLFDVREGYCDYYSSAMVVMLRAVGVPARYVRGYSQGFKEEGVFHVLEQDGHAWPEVFFPGYGWVEFEPTGGEPPLRRPASQASPEGSEPDARDRNAMERNLDAMIDIEADPDIFGSPGAPGQPSFWQRFGPWGVLAFSLLAFGLVLVTLLTVRRRRLMEGLSVAERVYEDLVYWVRRLFRIDPLAHQTPHEYARIVVQSVPQGRQPVEHIADLYVKERFGNKFVSSAEADVAWQQARSALWGRWAERKLDSIRRFWWRLVPPEDSQTLRSK